MELWDIYDVNRIKTGRTMERGKPIEPGDYHLVVNVCIFSPAGRMLIQQRQSFKEGWPDMWDISAGGSAIAGETSAQAAQRELSEELGYLADFSENPPYLTMHYNQCFSDYYLLEAELEIDTLTLQYEEVQQARWATQEEILKMIGEGTFLPYHESFVRLLFDLRRQRGALYPGRTTQPKG